MEVCVGCKVGVGIEGCDVCGKIAIFRIDRCRDPIIEVVASGVISLPVDMRVGVCYVQIEIVLS